MAFFATIEDLPAPRNNWSPRQRGRRRPWHTKPPVRPPKKPRTVPNRAMPKPGCQDGQKRVKRLVYGFERMVCATDSQIPYAYRSLIDTNDQLRGRRKPLRVPDHTVTDRKPTRRSTTGYLNALARYYVNENPRDN